MGSGGLPLKGRRVLIVEGDYLFASDLRRLMQQAGATVIGPAWSLQAGLDLVDREILDAALLDAELANGSAEPIATVLLARGVPFVVVTGYNGAMLTPALREAPYMDKPVHYGDLIAMVTNCIRGRIRHRPHR